MPKVNISQTAEDDFKRLANGILEYISYEAVEHFTDLVEQTVRELEKQTPKGNFSLLGRQFHETRAIANKKRQYKFLYEYDENLDEITILSIKDGRQESFTGFPPIWTLGK